MPASKSRLLLVVILSVCALAGAGLLGAGFFLGTLVKGGINSFAPRITGTTVTLDNAHFSPITGTGTLTGLTVGNPPGWSDAPLARLGRIHVDVAPSSLLGDTVIVRDLVIESPEFRYETKLVSSNVRELLKHIEQAVGGTTGEAPTDAGPERKYAVQRFILRNGQVTIGGAGAAVTVPLPDLELNDLGRPDQGLTPAQLTAAISKEVVGDIVVAAAKALTTTGSTSGAAALEGAKQVGEALKGLFGGNKDKADPPKP